MADPFSVIRPLSDPRNSIFLLLCLVINSFPGLHTQFVLTCLKYRVGLHYASSGCNLSSRLFVDLPFRSSSLVKECARPPSVAQPQL
jgi:hypothetical protein